MFLSSVGITIRRIVPYGTISRRNEVYNTGGSGASGASDGYFIFFLTFPPARYPVMNCGYLCLYPEEGIFRPKLKWIKHLVVWCFGRPFFCIRFKLRVLNSSLIITHSAKANRVHI